MVIQFRFDPPQPSDSLLPQIYDVYTRNVGMVPHFRTPTSAEVKVADALASLRVGERISFYEPAAGLDLASRVTYFHKEP